MGSHHICGHDLRHLLHAQYRLCLVRVFHLFDQDRSLHAHHSTFTGDCLRGRAERLCASRIDLDRLSTVQKRVLGKYRMSQLQFDHLELTFSRVLRTQLYLRPGQSAIRFSSVSWAAKLKIHAFPWAMLPN